LKQQTEEKNNAYTNWRDKKCREMIFENKKSDAAKIENVKELKNQKIDTEQKKMSYGVEEDRKIEKEKRKVELKDFRRQEKAKKRHLNVEICSEILDLIMDVADEAFDSKEIQKPMWRNWMEVFTQGKKVSEINMVINEELVKKNDSMAQILMATQTAMDP
jgi:hypothetical protein